MMYEQGTVRNLYKRLLTLYPRSFREELGESMEQTFNDLCNEKLQTKSRLFGFVFWTFIETATGIIQEHILLITQGDVMKNILTNLRSPAFISFLLMFSFMIMELVNRRNFNEGFPIPLFGFLWVLPIIFIFALTPIVQTVQAGNSLTAKPINLFVRIVFLILIATIWVAILNDQIPCFLGVPNCD